MCKYRVSEICTPSSYTNSLETQRGTSGGGSGSPALVVYRKIFFPCPCCGETGWAIQRGYRFYSPHTRSRISAGNRKCRLVREDIEGTHQGRPCFFLQAYRDNMRKWDEISTLALHELQGKIITRGGSLRKVAAAMGSSSDRVEGLILWKGIVVHSRKKQAG